MQANLFLFMSSAFVFGCKQLGQVHTERGELLFLTAVQLGQVHTERGAFFFVD